MPDPTPPPDATGRADPTPDADATWLEFVADKFLDVIGVCAAADAPVEGGGKIATAFRRIAARLRALADQVAAARLKHVDAERTWTERWEAATARAGQAEGEVARLREALEHIAGHGVLDPTAGRYRAMVGIACAALAAPPSEKASDRLREALEDLVCCDKDTLAVVWEARREAACAVLGIPVPSTNPRGSTPPGGEAGR